MRKIYENEEISVYSDKEFVFNNGRYLEFEDGSRFDIYDYTVLNCGKGEIELVYLSQDSMQDGLITKKISTDYFDSINFIGNGSLIISSNDENDEYVEIQGTEAFFEYLDIKVDRNTLDIYSKTPQNSVIVGDVWINGKRRKPDPDPYYGRIVLNKSKIQSLKINSNGKGNVFSEASINILDTRINGAVTMELFEVGMANVDISGSGKVKIKKLLNNSEFSISGSGDVNIKNGSMNKIATTVSGSGSITAMVSVGEAYINLTGSGSILIDQIKDFSKEKRAGSGSIKILRRG